MGEGLTASPLRPGEGSGVKSIDRDHSPRMIPRPPPQPASNGCPTMPYEDISHFTRDHEIVAR
jgi:hypothetical protein